MTFLPRALHVVLAASALFEMSAASKAHKAEPDLFTAHRIASPPCGFEVMHKPSQEVVASVLDLNGVVLLNFPVAGSYLY